MTSIQRDPYGRGKARVEPMGEKLPGLLDCAALARELGIKRSSAEAVMRRLPLVQIEGLRKVYVRRSDVIQLLNESTNGR